MKHLTRIVTLSAVLGWFYVGPAVADEACQEAQEILGLSLRPVVSQEGEEPAGLAITEIVPLSQGARVGLREGDVIEQVNSWSMQDCKSYRRAVRDAQKKQKAVLMLVSRKGQREPIFFDPEMWQREEEKQQEKEAVASLQTMLTAPLPPEVKAQTDRIGDQALATLQELEAVAVLPGPLPVYEREVTKAKAQIASLDRNSQTEAEKRVVTGAKVLLGYYVTAEEIRQYKQDHISEERRDLRKGRAAGFVSVDLPYFLDSPIGGWVDKYPFLRASIRENPTKTGWDFVEQPGRWDPDLAVQLLWDHAKQETETFTQWVKGEQVTRTE